MEDVRPIIATLVLDEETQAHFDTLRRRHFPPERNYIDAHVTMFHHLPGDDPVGTAAKVRSAVGDQSPFEVRVEPPYSLGGGVAYRLRSETLLALRARIADAFIGDLNRQDSQGYRPHVTVQNKVGKREARRTLGELNAAFDERTARAEGVGLWFYDGGPWSPFETIRFGDRDTG